MLKLSKVAIVSALAFGSQVISAVVSSVKNPNFGSAKDFLGHVVGQVPPDQIPPLVAAVVSSVDHPTFTQAVDWLGHVNDQIKPFLPDASLAVTALLGANPALGATATGALGVVDAISKEVDQLKNAGGDQTQNKSPASEQES